MSTPLSSLKRALNVLDLFSDNHIELGVTEISRLLKCHKSSISRVLTTLHSEGFVEKNPLTGKYRLGIKLVELGHRALGRFDLKECASPFLEDLATQTNEIVHLSILDQNEIVYLDKKGKEQILTVATRIGGRYPAHASGMGKVLLSGLSAEERSRVLSRRPLPRFTPNTITESSKLLKELEKVRKQGFAIDSEESFPGIQCVAAPIRSGGGEVVAAVSISVPKQRMGRERIKELTQLVTTTARKISERMKSIP